jgi:hypothetical protein
MRSKNRLFYISPKDEIMASENLTVILDTGYWILDKNVFICFMVRSLGFLASIQYLASSIQHRFANAA